MAQSHGFQNTTRDTRQLLESRICVSAQVPSKKNTNCRLQSWINHHFPNEKTMRSALLNLVPFCFNCRHIILALNNPVAIFEYSIELANASKNICITH
jgi:hypothetical protein